MVSQLQLAPFVSPQFTQPTTQAVIGAGRVKERADKILEQNKRRY